MSTLAEVPASRAASSSTFTLLPSFPLMLVLAFLAAVLPNLGMAAAVWTGNVFYDTDDAMRMVGVRDLLAGQNWFDLTAYRLDPPAGASMHWSRLIDAPLAALIWLIKPLAGVEMAERIVRIAWPLGLHLALFALILSMARRLCGPPATAPAAFLAAFSSWSAMQFLPGRIDHHSVEIVLMAAMLRLGIEAVLPDGRSWRAAVAAALIAAIALQISLEDLPFVVALLASLGLVWIVDGEGMRPILTAFGLTLAAAGLALFVTTVPVARYAATSCDAYSLAHLAALALAGVAFTALAGMTPLLPTLRLRLAAAAGAALTVAAAVAFLFPACVGDPLAATDPLVRHFWLDRVSEAQSMLAFFHEDWRAAAATAATLTAAVIAAAFALRKTAADRRAGWMMVGLFLFVGIACSFWQIRVLPPTSVVVALVGVPAVLAAAHASAVSPVTRIIRTVVVLALVCPLTWSALAQAVPGGRPDAEAKAWKNCTAADTILPLNALTPGLVLAPIDLGAHILAYTPMSVVSAAYHRNNAGNRAAIEALSAPENDARSIVTSRGVRYIVLCPGFPESRLYIRENADGLAARLMRGRVPAWLEAIRLPSDQLMAFRVIGRS